MLHIGQFRSIVVRPILVLFGELSLVLENLLVGTALTESQLVYLRSYSEGQGIFGITEGAYVRLWRDVLLFERTKRENLQSLSVESAGRVEDCMPSFGQVEWNLRFACAICFLVYYQSRQFLPEEYNNVKDLAGYYRRFHNFVGGKRTVEEFMFNCRYMDGTYNKE